MTKKPKAAVIFIILASLTIAGCTNQQQTTQSASSPSPENLSTDQGVMIAVRALDFPRQIGNASAREGYKWVVYNTTVLNVNASDRAIARDYFSLQDTQGQNYNVSEDSDALGAFNGADHSQPDDSLGGIVVFEVTQSATPSSITYFDGTSKIVTMV